MDKQIVLLFVLVDDIRKAYGLSKDSIGGCIDCSHGNIPFCVRWLSSSLLSA